MGIKIDRWPGPVVDPDAPPRTERPGRRPLVTEVEPSDSGEPRSAGTAADRPARRGAKHAPVLDGPTRRSADGRVVVDPRLRARRVEVRRDAGRRRFRRVALVGSVVLLSLAAYGVVRSPLLAVREIRVTPTAHVDEAEILRASGIDDGTPMIDVNQGAVAARLEAVPWVANAKVTRSWPGTVTISVTERSAAAQLHVGDHWYLLDESGRVLGLNTDALDLPVIEGLDPADPGAVIAGAAPALRLASNLPPRLVSRVKAVRHGKADAALDLVLVGGGVIRFGSTDQLDRKIVAAVTMLDNVEAKCLGTVDVQVPNAPTLTPTPACA